MTKLFVNKSINYTMTQANNNINIEDKKILRAKIFSANFCADMLVAPHNIEGKPVFSLVTSDIINDLMQEDADVYPYKLALIPLSKISNEHAMAAGRIVVQEIDKDSLDAMEFSCLDIPSGKAVFLGNNLKFIIDSSREFFLVSQFTPYINYSILNIVEVMDYLRDMGYDLGHGNIKSLIAADYAIDKTTIPAQAE